MNPCERVDTLLSAYLEDETSVAETRFVEGHLTACGRCRAQRDEVERLLMRVRNLPRATVSEGFTERVLDAVTDRRPAGLGEAIVPLPPSHWNQWGIPLAAAATIAVVLFVGLDQIRDRIGGDDGKPVNARFETVSPPETMPAEITPPESRSLAETDPIFQEVDRAHPAVDLGLATDRYVLEDWTIMTPTGGGEAVLTRVGAEADEHVLVTF